jgi:hypothetical protein
VAGARCVRRPDKNLALAGIAGAVADLLHFAGAPNPLLLRSEPGASTTRGGGGLTCRGRDGWEATASANCLQFPKIGSSGTVAWFGPSGHEVPCMSRATPSTVKTNSGRATPGAFVRPPKAAGSFAGYGNPTCPLK